jgi:hypothetical protein
VCYLLLIILTEIDAGIFEVNSWEEGKGFILDLAHEYDFVQIVDFAGVRIRLSDFSPLYLPDDSTHDPVFIWR